MSITLFEKLRKELNQARDEKPLLDKNSKLNEENKESEILKKSTIDDGKFGFEHGSHNSHGDWGKHWAHGGYEDDEPQDDVNDTNVPRP